AIQVSASVSILRWVDRLGAQCTPSCFLLRKRWANLKSAIPSHNGSAPVANTMRSSRKRGSNDGGRAVFCIECCNAPAFDGGNVNRHDLDSTRSNGVYRRLDKDIPDIRYQRGSSHAHLHLQVRDEEGVTRLHRRCDGEQTPAEPRSLDCYGGGRSGQGPSP